MILLSPFLAFQEMTKSLAGASQLLPFRKRRFKVRMSRKDGLRTEHPEQLQRSRTKRQTSEFLQSSFSISLDS
jgi:hypothetical protein